MSPSHEPRSFNEPDAADATALVALLDALWRKKWLVIAITAVSIGIGAGFLALSPPVHRVTARLLVQTQQPLVTDARNRVLPDKDFIGTQAEIVRSPAVVEQAVARFRLVPPDPSETEPVVAIARALAVTPTLGTNVLNVAYQSPDAEEGLRTVDGVIECYREFLCGIEQNSHVDSLRLLTRNERELRDELKKLEGEFRVLREKSPLMGQGKEAAAVQTTLLTHLGQSLGDTKSRRIALEKQIRSTAQLRSAKPAQAKRNGVQGTLLAVSEIHAVEADNAELLAQPAPHKLPQGRHVDAFQFPSIATMQEEILDMQVQLIAARAKEKKISETYGPKHPDVLAAREEVATWEQSVRKILDTIPQQLDEELGIVRGVESELADLYEKEFQKAKDLDGYLLKEQMASDEIHRVRAIHDSVLMQLKQRELADEALNHGRSGITVNVLEPPVLAERPAWPPSPLLVLAACGVLGLVGGVGYVSVTERMRPRGTVPQV